MATTNIHGTIVIGQPPTPIEIPIAAKIPPDTAGVFVFDYQAPNIEAATKINIGSFLTWLGTAMKVDIPVTDLPESLQSFTIAVLKFHLDTQGNFDIQIEIGSMVDGKWTPEWTPVQGLGITLVGLGFEVTNMSEPSWLQDWLQAHGISSGQVAVAQSPAAIATAVAPPAVAKSAPPVTGKSAPVRRKGVRIS
jgi:hypothetical protein